MTFEDLSKQLNTSVQSLQNLVQVLSAAFSELEGGGGGMSYSTSEFDTGMKYIDGKKIYGKVFSNVNVPDNAYTLELDLGVVASNVIRSEMTKPGAVQGSNIISQLLYSKVVTDTTTKVYPTSNLSAFEGCDICVFYTK